MFKAWKIGTDVFSYLNTFITNDYWGQEIKINKDGNKITVFVNDESIKTGDGTTIGQFLRIGDFLGIITKNRAANKVSSYYDGSIQLTVVEKPKDIKEYILEHIFNKTMTLFEASEKEYIRDVFPHNEDKFLFSIASTLIVMKSKSNNKFIEMQMDGTKVSDYSVYYHGLAQFLAQTKVTKYTDYVKKILIKGKDEVQKIIDNTEYSSDNVMEIYKRIDLKSQLQFDTYNLGSFIKQHLHQSSKIKIPIYQRKYRWSDTNILKLVRDIDSMKNIDKDFHNIGTMVTKNEPYGNISLIKIIDGQQRLTSLLIIFRAAFDIANHNGWDVESLAADKFKLENDSDEYDGTNDVVNTFLRIEGNDDFKAFTDLMKGNTPDDTSSSIIFRNYYSILGWMSSNIKTNDNMVQFWKSLTKTTIFATMTDTTSNEFILFEKLNTGAIPLTVMELVKNKILNMFSTIVDKNEKEFQTVFENKILKHFEHKTGKKKGEIDEGRVKEFIINILRVHGFQYNDSSSLYEAYNNIIESVYKLKVQNFSDTNKQAYKDLLSEMQKDIIFFNEITSSALYTSPTARFKHFSDYLFSFDGRTVYFPILYKIFKNFEKTTQEIGDINKTRKLLHAIETFEIRFQVVSYRGQSLSDSMQDISRNINEDTTAEQIFELFASKEKQKTITMPKLDTFVKMFKTFKFSNKLANIVSVRIENYIMYNGVEIEKGSYPILVGDEKAKISREHIMPQEKKNWLDTLVSRYEKSMTSKDVIEKYDDIVDSIGNALPIKIWKNSEVGAANMVKKISKYTETKVIPSLSMFSGFDFRGVKIDKVTKDFDFKTIEDRSESFSSLAEIIWGE